MPYLSDFGESENGPEIQTLIVDALNRDITSRMMLDMDALRNADVSFRPATVWLAQTLSQADLPDPAQKMVLNRMILEDALPGTMDHVVPNFAIWPALPPVLIDVSFNPFDQKDLDRAIATLKSGGLTLQNADSFRKVKNIYSSVSEGQYAKTGGIYYRPAAPYEVCVADATGNAVWRSIPLPNKSPILHLKMGKAALVTAVSQVAMTNGFISSYNVSKPSSALAAAEIPVTILSSITSSLTNLLQLKLNLATGQNALQTNQIVALSNSLALMNLQQQVNAALAAGKTNSTTKSPK